MRPQPLSSVFVLLILLSGIPARAATVPTGFTEDLIASGIASPTAMQFAPDGRLFVCEQGGKLRVIKDGVLLPTPFLSLTVNAEGERGLLGVALDPDFATNRYVYLYYTATTPAIHNRISRFTANGDVAVPGSELVLFELDNLSGATNHNGGALAFGPDGKLYAAVGENADGAKAQSLSTVLGKMLRLNKDGSIPTDNPFYSSASGRNRAIWALGLRNPFTFAFNRFGSEMFINDVGQNTWEEINDGFAGANYGWPNTEGPTTDTRFQTPRYAYRHTGGACAITGGAFYSPLTMLFPPEYSNDYFFADHCEGWIRKLDPAAGNRVDPFATGLSFPVDLKVADDGTLYYLSRGPGATTGAVYRIRYGASVPGITAHPISQTVAAGASVTLSVRASGVAPLRYQWQRNSVAVPGATAPDYTFTAGTSDNQARFRAVVSNDLGSATSNEAILTVTANQPPTGVIATPAAGTQYSGGTVINYSATASDPQDGTLPASAFTWWVDFHHDTHTHPFLQPTTGATSGSFTIPTAGETSPNVWYRIYLTVRDSAGLTHTSQRDILPRKASLTLTTSPTGLQLSLDGQPIATPTTVESVVGIVRNIQAVTPQSAGGTSYEFVSWSDGGAAQHNISTPAASTTYTATFRSSAGAVPAPNPALKAAYHFNAGSGGTVADASGNGLNGTISGAIWTTSGRFGGGLSFDGIDDVVTVAANPLLDLTTAGTLEAWVRFDVVNRWNGVIAKSNVHVDASHNYAIEVGTDNIVNCLVADGATYRLVRSTTRVAAQQFYHLACTWDGAQLKLYVNAVLEGSVSQLITPRANTAPLFLGQYGGNVDRMDGVIDEVRIYNTALSLAQIQTDMNTPLASVPGDTTPPVLSNPEPTGTLVAGTKQTILKLTTNENASCRYGTQAGAAYGSLPNQFSTTGGMTHSTTVSGLTNGTSYTYYIRCQDTAGNPSTSNFAISFAIGQVGAGQGLKAAYQFGEGSGATVADASGNGLNGTISGAIWTTSGRFGGGLSFDGIDDVVTVAANPLLDLTTAGTLEAWVRFDIVNRWNGVIAKSNVHVDASHNYAIEVGTDNIVNCLVADGATYRLARSTTRIAAQQFYHLACTWDGAQLKLYVNAVLESSVSQLITPRANTAPLFLGQYGGNLDRMDGVIDEVRIYNTALSLAQIQTDMNTPMGSGPLPVPSTALTSPSNGAAYTTGTAVPVAATATVAGDTIAKVDFMANGAPIGSDTTSPYGITWTPAAAGTYTITAIAQGSLGGTATSGGVNVTISAPTSNPPPSVSITFPAAGATFSAGASINVAATASDSNGSVSSVTFYHSGSQLIGTDTTNPYGATWSNVAAGTYSLTAVALDNGGASTVSAAVMITVNAASSLPRSLVFTASTDHATLVTSYTMDVFASGANPSTAAPVRTQNLGKPAPVNGDITVDIASLVQGLPTGSYFLTVTAVGSAGSTRSTASPTFQR